MSARPPSALPALRPISMKPACEIDGVREDPLHVPLHERREVADRERRDGDDRRTPSAQRCSSCGNAVAITRNASTSAATFVAADIHAVTVVGAPS